MLHRELDRQNEPFHIDLSFAQPLEARFQLYFTQRYRSYVRIAIVLGALMLIAGGIAEWFYLPAAFAKSWYIRLLILFLLAGAWQLLQTDLYRRYYQPFVLAASLILNAGLLLLALLNDPPNKHLYYSAMIIVQIFIFVLTRLQFKYSLLSTLFMLFEGNLFLFYIDVVPLVESLSLNYLWLCGSALTLCVSYLLERSIRTHFLHTRILGLEKSNLTATNLRLQDKLLEDSMTHTLNRRGFDDTFAEEWNRALRNHYSLALIMFDIDYFKQYNDTYGHIAGDECLKTVANVPLTLAKRTGDLVARYGGEEFAIILVGTSLEDAKQIAETIRDEIERLGIPHCNSPVSKVITISCGVAAMIPSEQIDRRKLVEQADKALYSAKNNGRNRVESAGDLVVLNAS